MKRLVYYAMNQILVYLETKAIAFENEQHLKAIEDKRLQKIEK